ncbi:LacI family DNA-binding transcriptional regulator [Arthrobacter sp. ISL-95]|uniref:LacI family DNA-binding transcriptional regulator n=1 Tax=Arthrobacter sp. ISL-95 TaxID=2819116 RepID=UPI001BECE647|nr:LacI family DNA-binding transcriptional regulator [Arthrobacter sp. ISL-95]MBT2588442.1 LacI family DNA-binding transcriptional regulator [Arthrobacter sp. ISL-95]
MTHPPATLDRPATIADVARLAGVSVPTVSRVLTGAARVSEERRHRVDKAIASLGYRPSAAAQVLASRRSMTIAIVAANTSRYGYAEAIRGVEESARAAGYAVIIVVVESERNDEVRAAVDAVLRQSVAGVVILKFDPPGVAALKALQSAVPVVALSGVPEAGVPQAVLDESEAAAALTEHLLNLGHATVHHVRIPPSGKEDGRTTGWRLALQRHRKWVPPIEDVSWDVTTAYEIGTRLAKDPEVTAVFCGNDETAMGLIRGVFDSGKKVPRDISVVGFDDHPLASMFIPALTTARQDFAELGRHGTAQLMALLEGESPLALETVEPPLVFRESTAPPSKHPR